MSPAYHTLVYGEARKMKVDLVERDENSSSNVEEEMEEVSLYGDKMKLRGEIFLTCGAD